MDDTPNAHATVKELERSLAPIVRDLMIAPADPADLAIATTQFTQLKAYEKLVKDREAAITKPLNEALKSVRALFTPVKDRVANLINDVRHGLALYNTRTTATLDKQRAKLDRKVEAGTLTPGQAAHALATKGADLGAGIVTTRTHKVVTITNPELVPDRYWVIDEVAVRKDALTGRAIPGVTVTTEDLVVKPRT